MAVGGKVALMVLFCLMVATAPPYTAEGAMTCQMVVSSLTPCASYLTRGGPVPASCCSGITSLYKAATTTTDRQTACRCMEQAAGMVPGIDLNNAGSLPGKCGVKIPYKISPTTDCSKVQ
ncbi:non-specific lipid-transfer protein 1-like [Cynara cardunculus var. scolymus]|uniref:non-specific lipid-transfer protein 1-like n=1 Tax=Cynara cardunculus var. scolymus TaxID=59895 RepID=UPI000D62757A|nr:non-specific lipid-transfer protein 1-like [Cynara cardunculus var. scolymus]